MRFPLKTFNPFELGLKPIPLERWLSLNVANSLYIQNKCKLINENLDEVIFVADTFRDEINDLAHTLKNNFLNINPSLHEQLEQACCTCNQSSSLNNHFLELALCVEDDLLFLQPDKGSFKLVGAALFSPSGWNLKDKQFLSIDSIHSPVPHYAELLGSKVNKVLSNLPDAKPFERHNWSIYQSNALYQPVSIKKDNTITTKSEAELKSLSIRIERQSLCRPLDSEMIIFSIKVYNFGIDKIIEDNLLTNNFLACLENLSDDMIEYKGLQGAINNIKAFLRAYL